MMPYRTFWVEPCIALEHNGVTIYHVYKNDDIDDVIRSFVYGYDVNCTDDGDFTFDVRELPFYDKQKHDQLPYDDREEYIFSVIRQAIDEGILTQDGINKK